MFSQWRQNAQSLYFKVWTLSCHLPLTSIYHILMTWHNLQQFKYSKKLTVYIFLTGLCASCFCTVCPVHLIRVMLKTWTREDLPCQYASWSIASKIKHTNVYHQDINYNIIFVILYLQQTLQPIRSLAYCTLGHHANNAHNVCIIGVCKVCKSTPN